MKNSPLNNQMKKSSFRNHSPLSTGKTSNDSNTPSTTLVLTPLVDAFAILVIYLLVNTGSPTELLDSDKNIIMPQASKTELLDRGVVVTFKKGIYYIDKKRVRRSELAKVLAEKLEAASSEIVIHADRKSNYKALNPILLASAEAGYTKIKFAVLQGGSE